MDLRAAAGLDRGLRAAVAPARCRAGQRHRLRGRLPPGGLRPDVRHIPHRRRVRPGQRGGHASRDRLPAGGLGGGRPDHGRPLRRETRRRRRTAGRHPSVPGRGATRRIHPTEPDAGRTRRRRHPGTRDRGRPRPHRLHLRHLRPSEGCAPHPRQRVLELRQRTPGPGPGPGRRHAHHHTRLPHSGTERRGLVHLGQGRNRRPGAHLFRRRLPDDRTTAPGQRDLRRTGDARPDRTTPGLRSGGPVLSALDPQRGSGGTGAGRRGVPPPWHPGPQLLRPHRDRRRRHLPRPA